MSVSYRAFRLSLWFKKNTVHGDCQCTGGAAGGGNFINVTQRNMMQSPKINALIRNVAITAAAVGTLCSVAGAHAQQSFTATVDGKAWESDHGGITVIPVGMSGTVTISAASKGFSTYPPTKGFADRFSFTCPMPKKPERYIATRNQSNGCRVSFTKAARDIMSPDWATTKHEGEYESMGGSGDKGYVNFTTVSGKLIEGEFAAELVETTSKKKIAVSGKFRGIDKQVGSKGFNYS